MQHKTIFISIPWFLPAYKAGGPIQSIANLVTEFNENIQYKIFCSNRDLDCELLNIETDKWIQYNLYTQVWYATSKNIKSKMQQQVKALKPDVLFIVGLFSLNFNIVPLLFCKRQKKIISIKGMLHPGALLQKKIKKKIFLFLFKVLKLNKNISFHATDEVEKKHIQQVFGNGIKIFIAGNFPRQITSHQRLIKAKGNLSLISIALISPIKNILLVLKALEKCNSNIDYHIFGLIKEEQYWENCLDQIKKLPANINVKYHGPLHPNEVEEKLKQTHIFILPSESENFGHAIYEALGAGKPVITSNNTPWQELEQHHAGLNISTTIEFIKKAIEFFAEMSQQEYEKWSIAASQYAKEKLDISNLRNQYEKMFFS